MIAHTKTRVGPKTFTHEQWLTRVAELGNGEYTALSRYEHNQSPVKLRHDTCGTEFEKRPNDWKRFPGCPTCNPPGKKLFTSLGRAHTIKEAQAQLDKACGPREFTIIGSYVNNNDKTLVRHNRCGHEWETAIRNLTRTKGTSSCPKCARKWTKERMAQEVAKVPEGDEYEVVGDYQGSNTPLEMRHVHCGNVWFVTPNNFLNGGTRCPVCSTPRNSRLVRVIDRVLNDFSRLSGFEIRREYVFQGEQAPISVGGRSLRFDFWIPKLRLIIEADGLLHQKAWNDQHGESRLRAQQANDKIKDEWARLNQITLVRVSYDHPNWQDAVRDAIDTALESQTAT